VCGNRPEGMSSCETINQLMELLEPLEAEIVALASNLREPVKQVASDDPVHRSGVAGRVPVV
jgi:hypothetical protein